MSDSERMTVTAATKLVERLALLEEVLLPFAAIQIGEHRADEENVWHGLTVRDFRRARAVLEVGPASSTTIDSAPEVFEALKRWLARQ